MQDARRFVLRHYQTIAAWPLQTYSSATVFSPEASAVRRANLGKVPQWLRRYPRMENEWTPLIQTLVGHSDWVSTVVFSPDGKRIVSGSEDMTVKLWDAVTGELQRTLAGHRNSISGVVFSPDGECFVSESRAGTIKRWDTVTGELQRIIQLCDTATEELQWTPAGYRESIDAVVFVFSPDGKQIAGPRGNTIKLWDATTGDLQGMLVGHSKWVSTVAFSPSGKYIASGSGDKTIK